MPDVFDVLFSFEGGLASACGRRDCLPISDVEHVASDEDSGLAGLDSVV